MVGDAQSLAKRPDWGPEALTLNGITFTASGGSAADFTVWAERAQVDPSSEELWLEQVGLTIHASTQREAVEIRCVEGHFLMKTESFRLQGNVRGRIGVDRIFRAQWVAYDEQNELLYSEAPVEVEEAGSVYRGGGFRYAVADGILELVSGVQVFKE
ncbi:MAG: LPS export ABC transporter periplasmic protein LptC [Myxococcota bacterium]|nr:LPS export ABC transporter periplasmic protein LptC [Myxococcota bacterium]